MGVTVIDHPLAAERLAVLRDENTPNGAFRQALHEVSEMLVYEASRNLVTTEYEVTTPLAPAPAIRIDEPPLLVPVLRAGLGMLEPAQKLLPTALVGFVGMKRDEATFDAHTYMATLPPDLERRPVFLLDPMLATGGSLCDAADLVNGHNPGPMTVICVLAAPEGIERFTREHEAEVFTAAVDDELDDSAFIVPGLGDAGDRQFGVD